MDTDARHIKVYLSVIGAMLEEAEQSPDVFTKKSGTIRTLASKVNVNDLHLNVMGMLMRLNEDDPYESPDEQHSKADDALCCLLVYLGYADVVEAWKKIPKYFA